LLIVYVFLSVYSLFQTQTIIATEVALS